MSVAVDRDQAFLDARPPHRRRGRGPARRRRRPRRALPARDDRRAARGGRARRPSSPSELGGGGVSFEALAAAPASSSAAAAAPAPWSSRCTRSRSSTIVRHLDDGALVRGLPARASPPTSAWSPRSPPRSAPAATWAARSPRVDARRRRRRARSRSRRRPSATASYADDLLTTLRRDPDAEPRRPGRWCSPARASTTLEPTGTWDPLGMRGTCSPGYVVRADVRRPSRCCRRRSRASRPSRWSRSRTSSGRTCGWASPPTPSTAPARSCAPRPAQARASRRPPRRGSRTLMSELSLLRAEVGTGAARVLRGRTSPDRERLSTMAVGAALQQPQDRRLRAGAAGLPGRDGRRAASSASRTTRRSASAATCATRCRPA